MSKWAALTGPNGTMVATVTVVAVAAIGAGVYFRAPEAPGADVTPVAQPASPQPVVQAAQVPEAAPETPVPTEALPTPAPPSIDEVRLEPDGLTIIAGRATPGSEVSVMLDGAKNTSVTADPGGTFAAITILPASPKARVLTVTERVGADEIKSVDEVILAPQAKPVVVADAPAADPTPVPDTTSDAPVATAAAPIFTAPDEVEDTSVVADTQGVEPDVADHTTTATSVAPVLAQDTPEPSAPVVTDTPALAAADRAQDDAGVDSQPEVTEDVVASLAPQEVAPPVADAPAKPEPVAPVKDAPAPDTSVTVLKSTAEGVEVLGTTGPEALDNIEIDTISYSAAGDVQLAGRAQSEADVVRVYVNNQPIVDLGVDAEGKWRGDLPSIDTGVYTLRVDELNEAGEVTSRVETPFRREDPAVLAQIDDKESPATQITVQTGNTLWGIARDRYGEGRLFEQVFQANRDRIRDADLIFPGQVFALPE